jgi:hypothetical protein
LNWEQNILDARYLPVNRLAYKCIQRHGLNILVLARGGLVDQSVAGKSAFFSWVFEIGAAYKGKKFEGRAYLLAVCR